MRLVKAWLRGASLFLNHQFLRRVYRMNVAPSARISLRARLDRTHPSGVSIGDETFVAAGAVVLAHDFVRELRAETRIGKRCFIGVNAIVMPGVEIGDHCIVGAGSVVTSSVPSGSIVAGNPARVVKTGITTRRFGQLER